MDFYEALKRLEKAADQASADLKAAKTEPQRKYALKMCDRADTAVHMLRSGFGQDAAFRWLRMGA